MDLMIPKVLKAPGFTRQHAAIDCLATNLDHNFVPKLEHETTLGLVIRLVEFASTTPFAAQDELSNSRLTFQTTYKLTERYAIPTPSLTKVAPRETFFDFKYTQDVLEPHFVMVCETALRIAARVLLLNPQLSPGDYSPVFTRRPDLIDLLLDIASRPRFSDIPHCESKFIAILILSLLLKLPGPKGYFAWGYVGPKHKILSSTELEARAFASNISVIFSRRGAVEILIDIYQRALAYYPEYYHDLYAYVELLC